jgi:uncharacterized YigZ family protein
LPFINPGQKFIDRQTDIGLAEIYAYDTIAAPSEGTYQERGSKFLAHLVPVTDRKDFEAQLHRLRTEHPKARHHCYAYRLLEGHEVTEYASDDGEPSNSAGQPMLGELKRHGLLNVCAIVVRYFGGTKLGVPGLIHAYRESVSQSIGNAKIIHALRRIRYTVRMPHGIQPVFYSACKHLAIDISEPRYTDAFEAILSVPMEANEARIHELLARMAGIDRDTAELIRELGLTLHRLQ